MHRNKKHKTITLLISISILLCIDVVMFVMYENKNKPTEDNNDLVIAQNKDSEETKNYELKDLGIIECEKIELNAPVKETVELDVLSTAVGHFEETALYNGNICLAGHNSGTNKNGDDIGFFRRLNELEIGDEVIYHHTFGDYIYKVADIKEISETDFSVLEPTQADKLTLITCVKGQKKLRYCVVCDRI